MHNFGKITLFQEKQTAALLTSDGELIPHQFDGVFNFRDDSNCTRDSFFQIFDLEDDDLAKKHLSTYGTARSPFQDGKIISPLGISDSLLQYNTKIPGYTESILLHELMDRDDHEDSMLKSEECVIKRIQEANWLQKEDQIKMIKSHALFFQKHKDLYEELFATYAEYYSKPENKTRFDIDNKHFMKIKGVVDYLDTISQKL